MHARRAAPIARATGRVAATLLLVVVAASCSHGPPPLFPLRADDGERPNLVLITVDTLRADHLGAYGYPISTSPAIDHLAASGIRFAQAIASAPETAPATATVMTGLYQYRSRVFANRGTIADRVDTLAERLKRTGYATAGWIGNGLVGASRGFAQGFDEFGSFEGETVVGPFDAQGVDLGLAWLAKQPKRPWFLWLHLMDPHGPYLSAPPQLSADITYPPGTFGADPPIPKSDGNFGLRVIPEYQYIEGLTHLSEYVRRYDGEIRWTDAQIGRLLAALDQSGAAARTIVVLVADHGESLTEHDEYLQHGWFLYDQTLHVPLVIAWPARLPHGVVVAPQIETVDIVPTLIELLALAPDPAASDEGLNGRSLAHVVLGDGTVEPRPAFAVGPRENHQFAIRTDGWKLIHTPPGRPRGPMPHYPLKPLDTPEAFELYDLAADPAETQNVADAHPDRMSQLQAELARYHETFKMSGMRW